jgi:predicted lipid-binding transport protein (Tim44 family)
MGPIAGLAAGLGLAALMSHLGLGEAFANFLMMALLAVAAVFLIAFLMRRFGKPAQPAALAPAGAGAASAPSWASSTSPSAADASTAPAAASRAAFTPAAADVSVTGQPLRPMGGVSAQEAEPVELTVQARAGRWTDPLEAPSLPAGFDLAAFERVAKMIFIRLQAANDAGDLDDLRQFTTPEMFATIRLDLQERGAVTQHTDVERVDASVVDFATEGGRQIVSVRFQGLIREEAGAPSQAFDEVWHLVKPEGEGGAWAIGGIQQAQ